MSDGRRRVEAAGEPDKGERSVASGDLSARAAEAPPARDKDRLRLWIRILRTARIIEGELRERLKTRFGTTLPRFDVMAALYRHRPDGMLMSHLSRFLLVSNGNVTGIVDRLVADGLVVRATRAGDRRTSIVRLTPEGERRFAEMAAVHEGWVTDLMGGISRADARRFSAMLKAFASNWEE